MLHTTTEVWVLDILTVDWNEPTETMLVNMYVRESVSAKNVNVYLCSLISKTTEVSFC